jgi:hypothetical protein
LEILALFLLGLIAMLVIVPPIIRGKLTSSPLASTQSFQRSMQEMASSIEPYPMEETPKERPYRNGRLYSRRNLWQGRTTPSPRRNPRHFSPSEMRRRRLIAALTLMTFIWAVAALASGVRWCLITFAVMACLTLAYLVLSLIAPRVFASPAQHRHADEILMPPKQQAM